MKVVAISDTHNKLDVTKIPEGDLLIHAGDATVNGTLEEMNYFFSLFCSLPHKYKVFVPGNHDCLVEKDITLAKSLFEMHKRTNDYMLINNMVEIEGKKIFGFPYIPFIRGLWSFERNADGLQYLTEKIPDDIDILVTHSPARGVRDEFAVGVNYGNIFMDELFFTSREIKHVVCGHIHEAYGTEKKYGIDFYNAAWCKGVNNLTDKEPNPPIIFYV